MTANVYVGFPLTGHFATPPCWVMPECLLTDPAVPVGLRLYQAIGFWAFIQERPVSREEISAVFRISPRQAGDMMGYLIREGRRPGQDYHFRITRSLQRQSGADGCGGYTTVVYMRVVSVTRNEAKFVRRMAASASGRDTQASGPAATPRTGRRRASEKYTGIPETVSWFLSRPCLRMSDSDKG